MRASGAGQSQYKHGSFGLSHAGSRPHVGSLAPRLRGRRRPHVRVLRAGTSEPEERCLYCEAVAGETRFRSA